MKRESNKKFRIIGTCPFFPCVHFRYISFSYIVTVFFWGFSWISFFSVCSLFCIRKKEEKKRFLYCCSHAKGDGGGGDDGNDSSLYDATIPFDGVYVVCCCCRLMAIIDSNMHFLYNFRIWIGNLKRKEQKKKMVVCVTNG